MGLCREGEGLLLQGAGGGWGVTSYVLHVTFKFKNGVCMQPVMLRSPRQLAAV